MAGKVVHFELPYDDAERAGGFYTEVFGWQLMAMPDMAYTIAMTGPTDPQSGPTEPGFIGGGLIGREEAAGRGPLVVIDVDDIDAALAAVEKAGGRTQVPRQPVGEMGFAAYFVDTEGNVVGLWQSA